MNTSDPTRERLLDAAQHLFVKNGIGATSLRAITTEARANLAAVNYHFGSKEGLVQAVFSRWLEPLNQERLAWLNRVEEKAGNEPLSVEAVLEAFLSPAFQMMSHEKSRNFPCLLGRLHAESEDLVVAFFGRFREVHRRFSSAFLRALPHLPRAELNWRFHFLIGAMVHTFTAPDIIAHLPYWQEQLPNADASLQRLIAFTAAGFQAPVLQPEPEKRHESNAL